MRLLVLFLLLLPGCIIIEDDAPPEQAEYHGPPPGTDQVRQAASGFNDEVARNYAKAWPKHLPVSQDLPDLPIVRVSRVEDRGAFGVDLALFQRILEQAIRDHRTLRFEADENSPVLEVLREDDPPGQKRSKRKKVHPGLLIQAWTRPDGRFTIRLWDRLEGRDLIVVTSEPAGY